jgi:hypothetical protein
MSERDSVPIRMPLAWLALFVLCSCVFMCTAPGRITYPDDEIVFQTTQSLVEDHDFAIDGIAKRTGERADRPNGTFGWGAGRDSQRYGFFGQGLSVVAMPVYVLADATVERVPELWRYAVRSDLFTFHQRGLEADWLRLLVSLTNCLLTPLAAVLLGVWLRALGHGARVSLAVAAIYALSTTAWPYSRTFLSEPLSTVLLLGAALEVSRWHRDGRARHLFWVAGLAGISVHVHVLNSFAIPCLFAYAVGVGRPGASLRSLMEHRSSFISASLLCGLGLALLACSQWWRFGSPFETGRFDHYGHWVWPFEALLTITIAPGRSLLLYSPPLLLALWAWPALRRRDAATAWFVLALTLTRLLFVACRSDWHGGWAIGPRYLVPMVPFLLVPLAGWLDSWPSRSALQRYAALVFFVGSASLQAWLAAHSVFQVYWQLNRDHGRDRYLFVSDWSLSATPPIAFWRQQQPALEFWQAGQMRAAWTSAQFDMLGFGAWRLSKFTPADGLWTIMLGIMIVAGLAAVVLAWWWWRLQPAVPQRAAARLLGDERDSLAPRVDPRLQQRDIDSGDQ